MGFSYETCLRLALKEFPNAVKEELEKELDQYI